MTEILELNITEHRTKYMQMLTRIGYDSPYDSLGFFSNFSYGFENLICICVYQDDKVFLLPGYMKAIPGFDGYTDFSSPYGYSGPIISGNSDDDFFILAWEAVESYFKSAHTVSCFLRIGFDRNMTAFPGEMHQTLQNIRGKILSEDLQWYSFEHKVRKNVNRALKEGLKCKIVPGDMLSDTDLNDFYMVYRDTMERNNAQKSYYYATEIFKSFVDKCSKQCLFSFVYDCETAVSVEMVLISVDSYFSFLGGTLAGYFDKRPNDLLKFELINHARTAGKKYFVLGGGYGSSDGIFRYKKGFFPNDVVDYNTGRWVILPQMYSHITESKRLKYELDNAVNEEFIAKDFFPAYRKFIN